MSPTGMARQEAGDRARSANLALRTEMKERDNYYPEIEEIAIKSLQAVGYTGGGPPSEIDITDLAAQ